MLSVYVELMYLSKIITNFSPNRTEMPVEIRNYSHYHKAVNKCWKVIKNNTKNYKRCQDYCSLLNYNSNSPIIEGDPIFLT